MFSRIPDPLDRFGVGEVIITAQLDVCASASHRRGNGNSARCARLGNGEGFAFVLPCGEDLVLNTSLFKHGGIHFRAFNRWRPQQDGLVLGVCFFDVLNDCQNLLVRKSIDDVFLVFTDHRLVGWNRRHVHVVNGLEFRSLGQRGSRHARNLAVLPEKVLVGDCRDRGGFRLDGQAFFRFQRLMRAVAHPAARLRATCQLVNQHDFAALHHVVLVFEEQAMSAERRHDVVQQANVLGLVESAVFAQKPATAQDDFQLWHAFLRKLNVPCLFVHRIGFFGQLLRDDVRGAEDVRHVNRRTRHDQRRPRFVDQDRVSLINNHEIEPALHHFCARRLHLIPQMVKPDLGCQRISNVRAIAATLGVIDFARG